MAKIPKTAVLQNQLIVCYEDTLLTSQYWLPKAPRSLNFPDTILFIALLEVEAVLLH